MPLPASIRRDDLHLRTFEMRGYEREDGLFEVEGHLIDRKAKPLHVDGRDIAPGVPVHDMWVRIVFDDELVVRDVVAMSDVTPYPTCKEATAAMRLVIGERMVHGWTSLVKQRLGGKAGCTHLMEMLIPLATVAYQTLSHVRVARPDELDGSGRPRKIDTCYAFASERDVVKRRWPPFYTGDKSASA
jgi:hypothetical protein